MLRRWLLGLCGAVLGEPQGTDLVLLEGKAMHLGNLGHGDPQRLAVIQHASTSV